MSSSVTYNHTFLQLTELWLNSRRQYVINLFLSPRSFYFQALAARDNRTKTFVAYGCCFLRFRFRCRASSLGFLSYSCCLQLCWFPQRKRKFRRVHLGSVIASVAIGKTNFMISYGKTQYFFKKPNISA